MDQLQSSEIEKREAETMIDKRKSSNQKPKNHVLLHVRMMMMAEVVIVGFCGI